MKIVMRISKLVQSLISASNIMVVGFSYNDTTKTPFCIFNLIITQCDMQADVVMDTELLFSSTSVADYRTDCHGQSPLSTGLMQPS